MAQVLIRNIDDDVLARLKRNADAAGLSLETYLRAKLKDAARPSRAEIVAQIDAIRATTRPWRPGDLTSVDYVREGREESDTTPSPSEQSAS